MKIILFVNKDIEANLAYNLLKEELLKHEVKIYYSESVGNQTSKPEDLLKLEYFEKAFIYTNLIQTIKEQQIATAFEFFDDDFESFEINKCPDPNHQGFIATVKAFEPDLFISIRFARIFREEIIKVPKKGILNLHSAILPAYRGIMGTLHNLKSGKDTYGCTLHYISSRGIDTGEIISIAQKPIDEKKSLLWHIVTLYPLGTTMLLKSIRELEKTDQLAFKEQNRAEGHYFSVPTEDDFRQLKALGFEVFNPVEYFELLAAYISPTINIDLFSKKAPEPYPFSR
jgi:methionyl-tRNA formyltransferase